ncbi:hypothetical protein EC07798_2655, partial [Escherichia coli 07798]
MSFSCSACI